MLFFTIIFLSLSQTVYTAQSNSTLRDIILSKRNSLSRVQVQDYSESVDNSDYDINGYSNDYAEPSIRDTNNLVSPNANIDYANQNQGGYIESYGKSVKDTDAYSTSTINYGNVAPTNNDHVQPPYVQDNVIASPTNDYGYVAPINTVVLTQTYSYDTVSTTSIIKSASTLVNINPAYNQAYIGQSSSAIKNSLISAMISFIVLCFFF